MEELTILLVEDDIYTCKEFVEYIDSKEDIILVDTTNSSSEALSKISYYQPDAVILDLELHHGAGNGLDVLAGIKMTAKRPYMLITTNNSSETTYEHARLLGADFIMYKHQKDYSVKNVVDFLYSLKTTIKNMHHDINSQINDINSPEYQSKRILRLIDSELNAVGISPKSTGYKYLADAIALTIQQPTSNIGSILAQKYKKSETSVMRAMQYAISKTWNSADIDNLLEHYTARITSDRGNPTTTEFICYYANKIKNAQ